MYDYYTLVAPQAISTSYVVVSSTYQYIEYSIHDVTYSGILDVRNSYSDESITKAIQGTLTPMIFFLGGGGLGGVRSNPDTRYEVGSYTPI